MATSTASANNKTDSKKAIASASDIINKLKSTDNIEFDKVVDLAIAFRLLESSQRRVHKSLLDTALLMFAGDVTTDHIDVFVKLYEECNGLIVC